MEQKQQTAAIHIDPKHPAPLPLPPAWEALAAILARIERRMVKIKRQ